jgi:uncharacterized 2Fe-2S/4Fe-4S cluster protein (DUF4445 family)
MGDTGCHLLLDLGTNGEMVINNHGNLYGTSCACGPAFEGCVRRQKVYGSSVIDAISMAVKTRHLSPDGVLQGAYFDKGIDISGVHLDMDILRQIIPAKAAIATGIEYLLKYAGVTADEVDGVYLAGGFGFYLSPDSAFDIGLLPEAFRGRVFTVGNTSLMGACRLLTDETARNRLTDYRAGHRIKILQLANEPDYQEKLLANMNFRRKSIKA